MRKTTARIALTLALTAAAGSASAQGVTIEDAWVELTSNSLAWEELDIRAQGLAAHLAMPLTDWLTADLTFGLTRESTTNLGFDFGTVQASYALFVLYADVTPDLIAGLGLSFAEGEDGPVRTDINLEWTLGPVTGIEVNYSPDGSLGAAQGYAKLHLTPDGPLDYTLGYQFSDCPDPRYLCGGGDQGVSLTVAGNLLPWLELSGEVGLNRIVDIDYDLADKEWLALGAEVIITERVSLTADWTATDHVTQSGSTRQDSIALALRWTLD